ncbi:MAG: insulinase family protein, partial [Armatimonadetes bacterium]|nr:insulinase family protein [Armatimonadota bacterium]
MSLVKHTLSNGVRVLVEPVDYVKSAAIGLWCQTGSRHELDSEAGITHLIEHMLFKGTPTRTAKEIAESIEGRGGSLNAFTDKESTCYYCRVLMEDVPNAIDVLTDMVLHPLIDPEDLKREELVVIEEIKRSEDEPGDHVHDLHLEQRWAGHPLGKPIIGTRDSVASFGRKDLQTYMDRRYRGSHLLLSISGAVDPDEVIKEAEKRLGGVPADEANSEKVDRPQSTIKDQEIKRDVEQVHFCIGADGCSVYDDELYQLAVLDGVLGGGMSSRLFQEIREKRGLAYSVGSYTLSYSAGGVFTVFGGTSREQWPQVQKLVREEFDKVMQGAVKNDELDKVKQNICGSILLSLEGMNSRMMRQSRN